MPFICHCLGYENMLEIYIAKNLVLVLDHVK